MRKAVLKLTGQMEAIPPEAVESSCERALLRHRRQDPVCSRAWIDAYTVGAHKEVGIPAGALHGVLSDGDLWESHPLSTRL